MVIRLTAISSEQEPHSTIAAFLIMPSGECHWAHAGVIAGLPFQRGAFTTAHTRPFVRSSTGGPWRNLMEEEANRHPKSNILLGCLGTERDPPTGKPARLKSRPTTCLWPAATFVHYS